MLGYLSIIFLGFGCALLVKSKVNISTKFLVGMILGWGIAILGLVCYLSCLNYYWSSVDKIFYIRSEIWNFMMLYLNVEPEVFIRMMNIGIMSVFYCIVTFTLFFTNKKKTVRKQSLLILAIAPVLQIILYDPLIQKIIQESIATNIHSTFKSYNEWMKILTLIFKVINMVYCVGAISRIIIFYWRYPKIKFLKQYILYHLFVLIPVISIFYMLFRWFPMVCVKTTAIKGYYNYITPHIKFTLLEDNIFYNGSIIILIIALAFLYHYHAMEEYRSFNTRCINLSIDTATLGINIFTHAIKNHIQGIKSEALYINQLQVEDERVKESIDYILKSCEECFNSIENGNKHLRDIELKFTLQSVEDIIRDAIKFCDIKVSGPIIFIPECSSTQAYIDVIQFKQVIINCIKNAQDAIKNIQNGRIEIVIKEKAGWIQIEIKDNGVGIKKENMNNIFKPFFSTKSSVSNWGIGLAFCYRIISAHDGKIAVESEEGIGTSLVITIPLV